jgi:outer membrane receptor for ferrienterochelin and colicin
MRHLLFFLPLVFPTILTAQDYKKLTGTVFILHNHEPFPGVNVEAVGTPVYELTDKIGAFEILAPATADSLKISFKGYKSQTFPVSNAGRIGNIMLEKVWSTYGQVYADNDEPLAGVYIFAKSTRTGGYVKIAETDSLGSYQLLLTREYERLTFSKPDHYPGDTIDLTLSYNYASDDIKSREIRLKKLPVAFFDYSISTGLKADQKISETPASVVLINQEEIDRFGFQTLEEILEYVTGLFLLDDYNWTGGGPVIGVRGFFSEGFNNNIVILVNGVNQYEDYWGNYPLSKVAVPVEAIDRIEIVRGPVSETYGNGAFFGAINIITHQKRKTSQGSVFYSHGSQATNRFGTQFSAPLRKLDINFAGSWSKSNGLDKAFSDFSTRYNGPVTTRGLLENAGSYILLSSTYEVSDVSKINLEVGATELQREVFESTTASSSSCQCPVPESDPDAGGTLAHITSYYSLLRYSQKLKKGILLESKFGYFSYHSSTDYARGGNRYGFSTYASQALQGEVVVFGKAGPNLTLASGLAVRRSVNLNTTFDIPGDSLIDGNNFRRLSDKRPFLLSSLYLQGEYKLGKLTAIAGIRVEDLNSFVIEANRDAATHTNRVSPPLKTTIPDSNPLLIPRAALLYSFYNGSVLKILYGQASKRPSFGNYTDAANLKPATIRTFELNYIKDISTIFLVNASLYHNQLDKLINRFSSVDAAGNSIYKSDNAGKVRTTGVELGIQANALRGKLKIDLSGSSNVSDDHTAYAGHTETGEPTTINPDAQLPYSPTWLAYGKISYDIQDKITVSLYARAVAKIYPAVNTLSLFETADVERIGNTIPGYSVVNINLKIRQLSVLLAHHTSALLRNTYINIKVSNLLNSDVRYPTTGNNQAWTDKGSPGFGRRAFLTIGYHFTDKRPNR